MEKEEGLMVGKNGMVKEIKWGWVKFEIRG